MLIHTRSFHANKNLIGRPNVIIAVAQKATVEWHTNSFLYDTLAPLVNDKPMWRFRVTGHSTLEGKFIATCFEIFDDGEKLGDVLIAYKGSDHKIKVDNWRINAKRRRGSGFHTEDPAKATIAIRRHFFRKGSEERLIAAEATAVDHIQTEKRDKLWAKNRAMGSLMEESVQFTISHLREYLDEYPQLQPRLEAYETAKREAATVDQIHQVFDSKTALLVVLDGGQYIVKAKEGTQTFHDGELTYDIRRKLGTLKLVDDGQMVSDIGCRVNGTTFVLLPSDEGANDEN